MIARVSTEEQREANNSLPAQIERMKQYTAHRQLAVVKEFSFDESAYKIKRDEFDRILSFLKDNKEKIAVCFDKVDRLSRNVFDKRVAVIYEMAIADRIELHFVSDGQVINSQMNAADKFSFGMKLGLAKYYSDAISDNVVRAFEQKRRKGEITGQSPLGYSNVEDVIDGKKNVIPDPQRAHLIVKIFELYSTGLYSISAIREKITEIGLRTRAEKQITESMVERILKETFYYGIVRFKKRNEYYQHRYKPLIDKALFDKCQAIKERRKRAPAKADTSGFIFSNLLTCADCGCSITPEFKRKKSGLTYRLYSCTNSKGTCKRRYVNENDLLKPIYDILSRIGSITTQTQETLVNELRKTSEAELAFHKAQVGRIQEEYNKLTNRKATLLDMRLDQSITKEDYDKKLQEIMDRLQLLSIELEQHTQADHDYKISVGTVLSLARRAPEIFERSEPHEKRQFINFLVQNPKMRDRELVYSLRKPLDSVLELASLQSKTTNISAGGSTWLRILNEFRTVNWTDWERNLQRMSEHSTVFN